VIAMTPYRSFTSDNAAGGAPEIIAAVAISQLPAADDLVEGDPPCRVYRTTVPRCRPSPPAATPATRRARGVANTVRRT
jgi:alpha-D-ribose 1-methylphosphonate 5-triphosphate synthase subunit PhnI